MMSESPGTLFIVAAPSGGGKTSLVRQLLASLDKIAVSISHTTRKKRPAERDGFDYFFIDETSFARMVTAGDFVEHAKVFNHYYGTSAAQINERLQAGMDIVLDIDWQGAQQIKKDFADAVSIFIIPPSLAVLKERLQQRAQDDEQTIALRMREACAELSHYAEFDYLIVNDDFDKAANELRSIVVAHRLSLARQSKQQGQLLSFMLSSE